MHEEEKTEEWRTTWEEALQAIRRAEHHEQRGQHEEAKGEAWRAMSLGAEVMKKLFTAKELDEVGYFVHEIELRVTSSLFIILPRNAYRGQPQSMALFYLLVDPTFRLAPPSHSVPPHQIRPAHQNRQPFRRSFIRGVFREKIVTKAGKQVKGKTAKGKRQK